MCVTSDVHQVALPIIKTVQILQRPKTTSLRLRPLLNKIADLKKMISNKKSLSLFMLLKI